MKRISHFYNIINVNQFMQLETIELTSIVPILAKTHAASAEIRRLSDQQKKDILYRLAEVLVANTTQIIAENAKDLLRMIRRPQVRSFDAYRKTYCRFG
jgi:hypothetical protein